MGFLKVFNGLVFTLTSVHISHGTPIESMLINGDGKLVNISDATAENFFCTTSTYVNQISLASPLVDDCQKLSDSITDLGPWVFSPIKHWELVNYGTCHFGVEGDPHMDGIAKIAYGDIQLFISESIRQYAWNSRVGTYGITKCKSAHNDIRTWWFDIRWGIY